MSKKHQKSVFHANRFAAWLQKFSPTPALRQDTVNGNDQEQSELDPSFGNGQGGFRKIVGTELKQHKPVEGILLQDGFQCSRCNYCATNAKTIDRHIKSLCDGARKESCYVQRLFNVPISSKEHIEDHLVSFFRADSAVVGQPAVVTKEQLSSDLAELLEESSSLLDECLVDKQSADSTTDEVMDSFHKALRWFHEFEYHEMEMIVELSGNSGKYQRENRPDALFDKLFEWTWDYLKYWSDKFSTDEVNPSIRQQLYGDFWLLYKSTFDGSQGVRSVDPATQHKYAAVLADLLAFTLRASKASKLPQKLSNGLPRDVCIAAGQLNHALEGHPLPVQEQRKFIHNLASTIFRQCDPTCRQKELDFVVLQYIFCWIPRAEEKWKQAKDVTSIISPLLYSVRVNGLAEVFDDPSVDITTALSYIQTDKNQLKAVQLLCSTMAKAKKYSDASALNCTWTEGSYFTELEVNNVLVSITGLRALVQNLIRLAKEKLPRLCRGADIDVNIDPKTIKDDRQRCDPAYNFLSDDRNKLQHDRFKFCIMRKVMSEAHLRNEFFERGVDGKARWSSSALERWLDESGKFVELLQALIHVTFGMPPRGSEYKYFTIKNTQLMRRSVFWDHSTIMLFQTHDKSETLRGRGVAIPRFAPSEVRDLLLIYLAIVRPFELFVVKKCESFDEKALYAYQTALLVRNGKICDGDDIGSMFHHTTCEAGCPLWLRVYRQASVCFCRKHIMEKILPTLADLLPFDLQMGHSSKTAHAAYGHEDHFQVILTADVKLEYYTASILHQTVLLQLDPPNTLTGRELAATIARRDAIFIHSAINGGQSFLNKVSSGRGVCIQADGKDN